MNGFFDIVRWEVGRTLKNKQFIMGMFLSPLIMALFMGVPSLLGRFQPAPTYTYAVVDEINAFEMLENYTAAGNVRLVPVPNSKTAAERVSNQNYDGYFVIDESFTATGRVNIYTEDTGRAIPSFLRSALTHVLQAKRMHASGVDAAELEYLTEPAHVATLPLSGEEEPGSGDGRLPTAIASGVLLLILIMSSGAMLLQSALQEKRDRMSEVVLSSVEPSQLMFGKVIGHFILGLLQIMVWLGIGLPIATFVLDLPIGQYISVQVLPTLVLTFLLGYLFFAAIFIGVGATMEDLQSASNSQGMVFMLPFLSFVLLGPVISDPDGLIAQIGSFFPITAPFVLVLRLGLTKPPAWEVLVSMTLLGVSIVIVTLAASRLFRVGMLMYGKSMTPREIWRWLRHN